MEAISKIQEIAQKAKAVSYKLAGISSDLKNKAIMNMADAIKGSTKRILDENDKDIRENSGLSKAMIDRLKLDENRVLAMADSLREIAALSDPVGEVIGGCLRPNGLKIQKIRVPFGVIAVIYESRPNVTSDCAGLCLKSGSACLLRGGSEALNTNRILAKILQDALTQSGLPREAVNFIASPQRDSLKELLSYTEYIDLVIPRGGGGLIKFILENSRVPVIKHYKGVCHTYVDEFADLNMAEKICFNAKVQRPGVCNAMETLLVHRGSASRFLPAMLKKYKQAGVEIRGCPQVKRIVKDVKDAVEEDWRAEYLDLILSVKVVNDIEEAIGHINCYGSHHSDSIVTEDYNNAMAFVNKVDSACVYVNASTRFTDGREFGMGAEIGISTDKLHARGPMGIEELTAYKYIIYGSGQVRE